jgi:hypothetical protein
LLAEDQLSGRRPAAVPGRGFVARTGLSASVIGLAIVVSFFAVSIAGPSGLARRIAEISNVAIVSEVSSALIEVVLAPEPPLPEIAEPETPSASVVRTPATQGGRGRIGGVNITFYDCAGQGFCGAMYNGRRVYEGAAACSWNLAIGTKFRIVGDPTGRVYVCEDRGLLANTWVDIFFYDPSDGYRWQRAVGRYGTIEIVSP